MRPHRPGIGKSVFVSTFGSWGKRKIFFFRTSSIYFSSSSGVEEKDLMFYLIKN